MFEDNPKDKAETLAHMHRVALPRANFHHGDARDKMVDWIQNDRRFDGSSPERLADRVSECMSNGAHLDLDDPVLQRGGERRPLDKRS